MDFIIRVAETNILIHSVYAGVYNACIDYLVSDNSQPDIEIKMDDILIRNEFERMRKLGEQVSTLRGVENLLIHQKIVESLIDRDVLLIHGAVIAVGSVSYMFTGPSGTGKTTHIRKWLENLKGSYVVNGDKPLLVIRQNGVLACGTPWCGKEHYGTNTIVPLQSIIYMERGNENFIKAVPFSFIFPRLLEQIYWPADSKRTKKVLALLMELSKNVSFYNFTFDNFKEDAFDVAFDALIETQR